MLDYKPNIVLSNQEFDVVGSRPIRHDGPDKVTGRARYGADIQLPNLLFGKMLRSPHPHARIRNIDASRALALPGVKAVVTAADLPEVSAQVADLEEGAAVNYGFYSRNVMAREKGALPRACPGGGCGDQFPYCGKGPLTDRRRLRGAGTGP